MDRSNLEIILEVGAGGAQRGTAAQRRCLAALSAEPAGRKMVLVRKIVIKLDHSVEAVARGCNWTKEISDGRGQSADQTSRPKSIWTNELGGERALGYAVCC